MIAVPYVYRVGAILVLTLSVVLHEVVSLAGEPILLRQGDSFPPPALEVTKTPKSPLMQRIFTVFTLHNLADYQHLGKHTVCLLGSVDSSNDGTNSLVQVKVPTTSEAVLLTNGSWAIVLDTVSSNVWFVCLEWGTNIIEGRMSGPLRAETAIETLGLYLRDDMRPGTAIVGVTATQIVYTITRPAYVGSVACLLFVVLALFLWLRSRECLGRTVCTLGIVSVLITAVVPAWVVVRKQNICSHNLANIGTGKQLTAKLKCLGKGQALSVDDVVCFLQPHSIPSCPSGGKYVVDVVGTPPRCTVHGN